MWKGGTVSWADFPQLALEKCSEHQRKDHHKTALVLPSWTCTTPQPALAHQKWPARTGDATSPPVADDCVCQSPKNSQPARPAHDHGPFSLHHNTLRRSAFSHPLCDSSRCLLFADHGRGGQYESAKAGLPEMEPRRPPTVHCGRALNVVKEGPMQPCLDVATLNMRHVTNQPTHASGPTSRSSSSSAWSRRSRVQNGLRIVAGVFATFANSVSHTFAVDRMTSAPPKPVSHGVWAAVHACHSLLLAR